MSGLRQILLITLTTLVVGGGATIAVNTIAEPDDQNGDHPPSATHTHEETQTPVSPADGAELGTLAPEDGVWVFYVVDEHADTDPESYLGIEVPAPERAGDVARLRLALETLLLGTTPASERAGVLSVFNKSTTGILKNVQIKDHAAVVNFGDLRNALPEASASGGRIFFTTVLNGTVFQFPEIRTIEYQLEGSCDAFWEWQQAGKCLAVTKEAWESVDRIGAGAELYSEED